MILKIDVQITLSLFFRYIANDDLRTKYMPIGINILILIKEKYENARSHKNRELVFIRLLIEHYIDRRSRDSIHYLLHNLNDKLKY
jgi:hypothetical protein